MPLTVFGRKQGLLVKGVSSGKARHLSVLAWGIFVVFYTHLIIFLSLFVLVIDKKQLI